MTTYPDGMAFPSASLFAIAVMARRPIEDAVSNPDKICPDPIRDFLC
jgi:hypothetical protein